MSALGEQVYKLALDSRLRFHYDKSKGALVRLQAQSCGTGLAVLHHW